jgi:hypothetical protein
MITEAEIEALGKQLADLGMASDTHAVSLDLIDHLEGDDLDAVLDRAALISIVDGNRTDEDTTERLTRLARATGCPLDEPIIPWLQERGLVEQLDDGGFRSKTAKPGAAT